MRGWRWPRALTGFLRRVRTDAPEAGTPSVPELEIRALRLVESAFQGDEPSVYLGSGMEPAGVRLYAPGDDVRAMDWRVTARTGRPHVRELVEERGLEVLVVLDRSASLHGGPSPRPGRTAVELCAAFAVSAVGAGHRLGLVEAGGSRRPLPPSGARDQGRRVVDALRAPASSGVPGGTGDLAQALEVAGRLGRPGSVAVVVSDFLVDAGGRGRVEEALARLEAHGQVLPVRVLVPGPEVLPAVGLVRLRDPETGRAVTLDTSSAAVRRRLREEAAEREAWWSGVCRALRLPGVDVDPTLPLAPQLSGLLARRPRRAS